MFKKVYLCLEIVQLFKAPPWEYRERRKTLQTSPKFRQSNPFKDYVDHSEEIVDSIIKNGKYLN